MLTQQLGEEWPGLFEEFDEEPAAAASNGQVHRAVWSDGWPVAVKIPYRARATPCFWTSDNGGLADSLRRVSSPQAVGPTTRRPAAAATTA